MLIEGDAPSVLVPENEATNQKIAQVCPKNNNFRKTMLLAYRIDWCACNDSLRNEKAKEEVFKKVGIGEPMKEIRQHYAPSNKIKAYSRMHSAKPGTNAKRRAVKNVALKKDREDQALARSTGQNYGPGIGYVPARIVRPASMEDEKTVETRKNKTRKNNLATLLCIRCDKQDTETQGTKHAHITSLRNNHREIK